MLNSKSKISNFFIGLFIVTSPLAQCLNDNCETPEQLTLPVVVNGCNFDCTQDIQDETLPNNFTCSYHNYNQWYSFDLTEDTFLCVSLESDYNLDGAIYTANGYNEGIQFFIYTSCQDMIFGTNCYWMSDVETSIINFDPSVTEWDVTVVLPAGQYIFEVDGFGWSTGCFELILCGENLLGMTVEEYKLFKQNKMLNYDILGRRIR
jgi:hypothetical protein